MMEKKKNVPVLRFPEFEDHWAKKELGDISSWASGGTPAKDNPLFWGGDIPWITASSMRGLDYSDSELKITEKGLKNGSKLAPKDNLLILVRGSMLFNKIPIGITSKDVAFNQDVKSINIDLENNNRFILYWFIASENIILNLVSGTGIGAGKLDLADLKSLSLNLPSLPEQQKVVLFLTKVEDKLQALKKKKNLLEQYKKGMLQKIFSQELRFKDDKGTAFPKWEKKKLGNIAIFIRNGLSLDQNSDKKGYKVTRIETISNRTIDFNKVGYVETSLDVSDFKLIKGDMLFSNINSVSHIGKIVHVEQEKDLYHGMNLLNIRIDTSLYSSKFIYYQLSTRKYKIYFETICNQAVSQASINQTDLKKTVVIIPCLKEQTKIANFLSAIDDKINLCNTQIEKTEQWKKGLLQKMFV